MSRHERLINLHNLLLENGKLLFESSTLFDQNNPAKINGKYRAVIKLSSSLNIKEVENSIANLRDEYIVYNKKNKYPDVLPTIIEPDILRMQIHANKAYYSKKLEGKEKVMICNFPSYLMEERAEAAALLSSMGYAVLAQDEILPRPIYVYADSILEKHGGESIRYRRLTGTQYRASYFRVENGELLASELKKIGVLIIPYEQDVEVVHSHKRKRRSDSVYDKKKPLEIDVPFRYGEIYLNN